MATEAQIAANRQNAQASTGPQTEEGKARSSQNAVSLGLFTRDNCVQPGEEDEYNNLYNAMWQGLSPVGVMEEFFATEIFRGAWRLRRCATAEADLFCIVDRAARQDHERREKYAEIEPYSRAWDPMVNDQYAHSQAAVDRARAQATGNVRRATAELRRLQTERLFRAAPLPDDADPASFGIASFQQVLPKLQSEAKVQLLTVPEPVEGHAATSRVTQITNRTQSAAAPTPQKTKFHHYRRAQPAEIDTSAA